MDDEKRGKIEDAVQGYKWLVKTGRKERPDIDSVRSAIAILALYYNWLHNDQRPGTPMSFFSELASQNTHNVTK
jgi:hypothetical protein